jgi:photosystem II stability/assembly factor-like uncharacterized protein
MRARYPGGWTRRLAAAACLCAAACGGNPGGPAPAPPPSSAPPAVADGWRALESSPLSPGAGRHDDLVFADEQNGWLINTRGEVHGTTDGGQGWERLAQFPGNVFPRCVGFASRNLGWVGNINHTNTPMPDMALFETGDGGRTWSNVSARITGPPVTGLCGMRVLDAATVVAVGRWSGPAVFVKTTDGGRTWTSRDLSGMTGGLVDVAFLDGRRGFAVGGFGDGPTEAAQRASRVLVLGTVDGGESWDVRYLGSRAGERAWKIQLVDESVGYVSVEGATPEGVVLRTADGGRTWQRLPVAPGLSFQGVGFVSPERGWLGSGASLYATRDGGATWQALALGRVVNRIRVLGPGRAYAAGDRVYAWQP